MNEARRDGRKSMTRRIKTSDKPPYEVGDVLYVREKHRCKSYSADYAHATVEYSDKETNFVYINDKDTTLLNDRKKPNAWLSGRYMLASFARDYIKITGVRSERLQDITEADARKEGVEPVGQWWKNYLGTSNFVSSAVQSFQSLWQLIHGTEAWKENPEVWVIEFEETSKPSNWYGKLYNKWNQVDKSLWVAIEIHAQNTRSNSPSWANFGLRQRNKRQGF